MLTNNLTFLFDRKIIGTKSVKVTCMISLQLYSKLQPPLCNVLDNLEKIQCTILNLISNVYYLDIDLYKGRISNLNIAIEMPCLTSYFDVNCNGCSICHRFQNILCRNCAHYDLDLSHGSNSNVSTLIKSSCMTL